MRTQTLLEARTRPITPRREPPPWLDRDTLRLGQAFYERHRAFIQQVLGTSSLAATFAARDVTPVLMQTGRLPSDFTKRMQETQEWVNRLLVAFPSHEGFLKSNYAQATALGELHRQVAETTKGALKWNPRERLPMNQQAYAFVLSTFAWWPLEALLAKNVVDAGRDNKELDAWLHYWSVLGYAMGVADELLPRSFAVAKEQAGQLRQAQYRRSGEPRPEGVPVLLGGQVRLIVTAMGGKPDKAAQEKLAPFAARILASMIALSPGENEALGLEKDATGQLVGFTRVSAS